MNLVVDNTRPKHSSKNINKIALYLYSYIKLNVKFVVFIFSRDKLVLLHRIKDYRLFFNLIYNLG